MVQNLGDKQTNQRYSRHLQEDLVIVTLCTYAASIRLGIIKPLNPDEVNAVLTAVVAGKQSHREVTGFAPDHTERQNGSEVENALHHRFTKSNWNVKVDGVK